jgi:hypothetical protein
LLITKGDVRGVVGSAKLVRNFKVFIWRKAVSLHAWKQNGLRKKQIQYE